MARSKRKRAGISHQAPPAAVAASNILRWPTEFALTIFIGAFLLFQIQPLIGKYILPWFGGGPGVWTVCMLFFQICLLAGYAYAHLISRYFNLRAQVIVHMSVLLLSLFFLPITPAERWKPGANHTPITRILSLLAVNLGLPYLMLASTSPLMQQWFNRTHPAKSPYRLYALSNVGSLLALITYPIFFETHFTRRTQGVLWSCGLIVYAVCAGICALRVWRHHVTTDNVTITPELPQNGRKPLLSIRLFWLALPACASMLLLATTNKMCLDIAVVPFLWVIPLALY